MLFLAGCGAAAQESSSVEKFKSGDEREVAQKIEDLQQAGSKRDPETICAEILAKSLVQELEAAGASCTDEMKKAIEDADDYDARRPRRDRLGLDRHGDRAARRRRADRDDGVHPRGRRLARDLAQLG